MVAFDGFIDHMINFASIIELFLQCALSEKIVEVESFPILFIVDIDFFFLLID